MFFIGIMLYTSTMLTECGPAVSPETTQAIIQVESGGNPLAVGDNTLKRSFSPKSAADAVQLATRLMYQGHNIDIGLMQVNSCHIRPMGLSLAELFDPCRNIRIGTTILAEFYRQHKTNDPAQSLFRALSAYNTGQAWKGAGYVNRILEAAGATYRISLPSEFVVRSEEKLSPKARPRKNSREAAASSPLFFDNLSSSMQAAEL